MEYGRGSGRGHQSIRYAWYVAALMTLVQVVAYLDRFLPSLLAPVLKQELRLTDLQIGLLLGPAFSLFYVTLGLPIGWLADRFSRRAIIAAGVATWCVMTALGAWAMTFPVLFLARLGLGVGEATVAPGRYFPDQRLFLAFAAAGAAWAFYERNVPRRGNFLPVLRAAGSCHPGTAAGPGPHSRRDSILAALLSCNRWRRGCCWRC